MSTTVISNELQFAQLTTHTMPVIMATGEPVKVYDKNAALLPCDATPQFPLLDEVQVWVRGELQHSSPDCIQISNLLQDGRVLAMEEEKGLVIQRKDDGNIIFYSIISSGFSLTKNTSVEDVRQLLKSTFAGWHHAYHEVFAMAKTFSYFLSNKLMPDVAHSK